MSPLRDLKLPSPRLLVAFLGCAVLLVTGCAPQNDPGAASSEVSELTSAEQEHAFAEYYGQEIAWDSCTEDQGLAEDYTSDLVDAGYALEDILCASVLAPYDWNNAANPSAIDLALLFVPALGDSPVGTMLGNPGGPGVPGIEFALSLVLSPGIEQVTENFDFLAFDPRGLGLSTPLACDEESSANLARQIGHCVSNNPIAHTMGTSQVARDMDLLRHLMGDEELNFLGYSYGSMLGATYATLFPERVGRMVLDSAENAAWASLEHNFDQQVAIADAMISLAEGCGTVYEVSKCPFTSEASLQALIDRLNANPLPAEDGVSITGTVLYEYLVDALYTLPADRAEALDTIEQALNGDKEALSALSEYDVSEEGEADLGLIIISCHSAPRNPGRSETRAHIEEQGLPLLLGGPEINEETLAPFLESDCDALPETGIDIHDAFSAPDSNPILVIGITGDHATPYQFAQELADELGNARLLTLEASGHAASYIGRSTCVDDAVNDYLLLGDLPAEGAVCRDAL